MDAEEQSPPSTPSREEVGRELAGSPFTVTTTTAASPSAGRTGSSVSSFPVGQQDVLQPEPTGAGPAFIARAVSASFVRINGLSCTTISTASSSPLGGGRGRPPRSSAANELEALALEHGAADAAHRPHNRSPTTASRSSRRSEEPIHHARGGSASSPSTSPSAAARMTDEKSGLASWEEGHHRKASSHHGSWAGDMEQGGVGGGGSRPSSVALVCLRSPSPPPDESHRHLSWHQGRLPSWGSNQRGNERPAFHHDLHLTEQLQPPHADKEDEHHVLSPPGKLCKKPSTYTDLRNHGTSAHGSDKRGSFVRGKKGLGSLGRLKSLREGGNEEAPPQRSDIILENMPSVIEVESCSSGDEDDDEEPGSKKPVTGSRAELSKKVSIIGSGWSSKPGGGGSDGSGDVNRTLWRSWLAWAYARVKRQRPPSSKHLPVTRAPSLVGGGGRRRKTQSSEKEHEEGEGGGREEGDDGQEGHGGKRKHGDKEKEEEEEEEEEELVPDELVDKIEHAKKAAAYQSEFLAKFDSSQFVTQFIQFVQINATILTLDIDWPPAIEELVHVLKSIFLLTFDLIPYKYTSLVVCSVLPFIFYFFSEIFWHNSARWRDTYLENWVEAKNVMWKRCTGLFIAAGLICATLLSMNLLNSHNVFAVVWIVAVALLCIYRAFLSVGGVTRKLYLILENDNERMEFFLQVRYWMRYLVLVALNLAYLPILARLFKFIYKARHYHEMGHEVHKGPWVTAATLCAVYGVGFPALILYQVRTRRRRFNWLPDPKRPGQGRYEAKEGEVKPPADTTYNFLELEQQVYNLERYLRGMPMITDVDKREEVVRRVHVSLERKRQESRDMRQWYEDVFSFSQGCPIDDFWRPLKQNYYWWKIASYYVERGLLVALAITQDGKKVAKSFVTIILSFVVIGMAATSVITLRPYLKHKENLMEIFFDLASVYNVSIALSLQQKWLQPKYLDNALGYVILIPNVCVILTAIYIMDPRTVYLAIRGKYEEFKERTEQHHKKEKEQTQRESCALVEAAYKGELQRVKELLDRGRADVRFRKPKDAKPVGLMTDWTPTQVAAYMGKHECLELLLQKHTLFPEEQIVAGAFLQRNRTCLHYLVGPLLRLFSRCSPYFPSFRRRRHTSDADSASMPTPKSIGITGTVYNTRLSMTGLKKRPQEASSPLPLHMRILPRVGTIRTNTNNNNNSYNNFPPANSNNASSSTNAGGGYPRGGRALRSLESAAEAEVSNMLRRPEHDEIATLVDIAYKAWSRDCLDLLLTYGSDVDRELLRAAKAASAAGSRLKMIEGGGAMADGAGDRLNLSEQGWLSSDDEAGRGGGLEGAVLMASIMERLYVEVRQAALETKIHHTAACAIHHARDLQWVMAPDKGGLLKGGEATVNQVCKELFRRIKNDHRSTKDMKVAAMRAVVDEVIRHGQVPSTGLQLDLSHFGLDDQYFRESILNVWDVTSLGVPTILLLDFNALTDLAVRNLVMKMRERAQAGTCSLQSITLEGNRTGIDSALLLADFIEDFRGVLLSVTIFKWECSAESSQALTFMRPSDKFLSIENAFIVALLVDAYVGLRRFIFTLRECEGPLPDIFVGRRRLNHLIEIDLRGNHLEGPLPPALLRIEKKNFHHNRLTLPDDLRDLIPLSDVDFAGIGLFGTIPPSLASLPNLTKLNLSNNPGLTGPVPARLFLLPRFTLSGCKLSLPEDVEPLLSTTSLNLSRQGLVGRIPDSWTRLRLLTSMDVSGNALEGPIPASLLDLKTRNFSHNHLSLPGGEADLVASLGGLTKLDLSNQGLCGRIPLAFTALTGLRYLKLSGNKLDGPIPAELLLLPSRHFGRNQLELPVDVNALLIIDSLDLNSQDLVGSIPPAWSTLTQLTRLDLTANKLSGAVPASLLKLPEVRLRGNRLRLPDNQDDLESGLDGATALDLRNQGLHGEIPEGLSRVLSLTRIDLSGKNCLEGSVPASLLQAVDQRGLELKLEGENQLRLPNESLQCIVPSFKSIVLSRSSLQGGLPRVGIASLTALERLNLSYNALEGEIVESVSALVSIRELVLSHNRFKGSLHSWLGNLLHLKVLDISHNSIGGILPEGLFSCTELQVLRAADNQIEGSLPDCLSQLSQLVELDMGSNKLVGAIPSNLHTLSRLRLLDLSCQQRLMGSIPECLSAMTSLETLRLNNNKLMGSIPPALCDLVHLRVLSLRKNSLVGCLPSNATNLVSLEDLDIGGNRLAAGQLSTFPSLPRLKRLVLDGAELEGEIPAVLRGMAQLVEINLSANKLSAGLPDWLVDDMPNLTKLNLGANRMRGPLPVSLLNNPSRFQELKLYGNAFEGGSVPYR